MNSVKFSVFSDLHHFPGVFLTNAPERLESIIKTAKETGSDFVIHCGDLLHRPSCEKQFLQQYKNAEIPTYHCIGNHECEDDFSSVLSGFELETGYYFFDKKGFRFIVLDLNYMLIDGAPVHYTKGNFFGRPAGAQLVTFPQEQREWFIKTVESSPYPCVVFSHQSLEREHNGMSESERKEIREMIAELKDKIFLIINGHHHVDNLRVIDGIPYLDLNSASYIWYDEPHDKYPRELSEKDGLISNTLIYNDPIHAIITINEDRSVKIEGMQSDYFLGVDPISANLSDLDVDSRKITPNIISREFSVK